MNIVEFYQVCLLRDKNMILNNISLQLNYSKIAIIGANGSGKSSLVRLINGLISPTSGTVKVLDKDIKQNMKQLRREVGFVFSNPDMQLILPEVREDLLFSLKRLKFSEAENESRIDTVLYQLNIESLKYRQIHTLSSGEKQLVALATILVLDPKLIIFDEPTTFLDLRNKLCLRKAINNLSQHIVLVTHDLDILEDYEQAIVLDSGRVAFVGDPKEATIFYKKSCF